MSGEPIVDSVLKSSVSRLAYSANEKSLCTKRVAMCRACAANSLLRTSGAGLSDVVFLWGRDEWEGDLNNDEFRRWVLGTGGVLGELRPDSSIHSSFNSKNKTIFLGTRATQPRFDTATSDSTPQEREGRYRQFATCVPLLPIMRGAERGTVNQTEIQDYPVSFEAIRK
ncbi:hypothetical protein DL95DRAFT_484904 [Leptodontidium sp. 2 PMI_412]|nr:hypothetical protein DL95DRAFT_484904 [Leptodontidium sp. 2 PMI_412]